MVLGRALISMAPKEKTSACLPRHSSWTNQSSMTSGLASWCASSTILAVLPANNRQAYSGLLRFRGCVCHFSSRLFRIQRFQWRWSLQQQQWIRSQYKHGGTVRLRSRRRYGFELALRHDGTTVHKAIHMGHRNSSHRFRSVFLFKRPSSLLF